MGALPAALLTSLRATLGDRIRQNEPLARHTSLRVGGPADLMAVPESAAELEAIVDTAARLRVPVTVLGGGSNLLVGDGGVRGVVVKLGRGFARVAWPDGDQRSDVRAGSAVQLGRLAREAVARGLEGLEHAEGIPGTVGGALVMNAGAYGGEVAGLVVAVEGVDAAGGHRTIEREALAFRYRHTELPAGFIVTAVRLGLVRADAASLVRRMDAVRCQRVEAQPHGRSAGSMFKNPAGDHAGRLIEEAGLKGTSTGGARISEHHANFIVNEGRARAVDVKTLMEVAQRKVWERWRVWLEPEVRVVGSW